MSERRRRRLDEDSRSGLPLFPLVLVVILAGLLMGGVLAHFFGGSKSAPQSTPASVAAVLPSPAATPAPIPTPSLPKITPAPSPSATLSPLPTPSATPTSLHTAMPKAASKSIAVAVRATPAPQRQPRPLLSTAPVSKTPSPQAKAASPAPKKVVVAAVPMTHAAAAPSDDRAAALVRSYLEALAHGDRAAASSYLAGGAPNETFMTPDSHIESIRSSNVGPQQYRVTADVQTASGEYYVTFTVEQNPGGLSITDHFSIKTQ